jgi:hypothetical protein
VMPNYPVPIAFDDAQKGRDKDMEKVYELLKTKL